MTFLTRLKQLQIDSVSVTYFAFDSCPWPLEWKFWNSMLVCHHVMSSVPWLAQDGIFSKYVFSLLMSRKQVRLVDLHHAAVCLNYGVRNYKQQMHEKIRRGRWKYLASKHSMGLFCLLILLSPLLQSYPHDFD